jgi:hypothetical protein
VRPQQAAPACADECRRVLVEGMAAMDTEVTATWAPPIFPSGYEPLNMRCPHGVLWHMEPTTEQRLRYEREGTS